MTSESDDMNSESDDMNPQTSPLASLLRSDLF